MSRSIIFIRVLAFGCYLTGLGLMFEIINFGEESIPGPLISGILFLLEGVLFTIIAFFLSQVKKMIERKENI